MERQYGKHLHFIISFISAVLKFTEITNFNVIKHH